MKENKTYKPLPDGMVIGHSKIEGYGLFTINGLEKDSYVGVTHIQANEEQAELFFDSLIRTSLGGFINHSDTPNAQLVDKGDITHMYTLKKVKPGEEITVDYNYCRCGESYVNNI